MPTELNQEVLKRLAKLGALARLEQIDTERQAILAAFPDLAGQRAARGVKAVATGAAPAAKRRRRHMTAAQRKEVAERMKKYWAERRKTKGKDKA